MNATLTAHYHQPRVLADLVSGKPAFHNTLLVLGGSVWVAGLSQVAIPLGFTPVPLSLGTFAVLSAGVVLGAKRAMAALILFLLVGLAGAPVFANSGSGAVPTLGYVMGYLAAATLVGYLAGKGADRRPLTMLGAMALGSLVIYLGGVPYLALATGQSVWQTIQLGVIPFLVGDLIKVVAAAGLFPAAWVVAWRKGR